jgi:glycosyltransferase involved in cell wall biosynthesis
MKILASLCTRGRYDNYLPMALAAIANQTRPPDHIIIYDDNDTDKFQDITKREDYKYLFAMMDEKGITCYIEYGQKKGQHFNDERANTAGYPLVWRIDDDCVPEPDVLEKLEAQMKDDVGAVGPSILTPPLGQSDVRSSSIDHMYAQNEQWFRIEKTKEVDHLHCSFLYRAGIAHFDLRLSNKSFRGETMFTYSLKLKGYKILITPGVVWHFKSNQGGTRTDAQMKDYENDQLIFDKWLSFARRKKKLYVLEGGLGDHYLFRQAIEPAPNSIISCCYPEVFADRTDCEIVSIAQAKEWVDIKDYNVYEWAFHNDFKGHIIEATRKLYESIDLQR